MNVILMLSVILVLSNARRFKGNNCRALWTGKPGQCKLVSECDLTKQESQLSICRFNGGLPMVCCANPPVSAKRKPGEISKQKCKEYAKYVVFDPLIGYTDFPHMALLGYQNGTEISFNKCGGSIISDNYILTAAHCFYDRELGAPVKAAIGMHNMEEKTGQILNIVKLIEHPKYRQPSRYNDIAVLKIEGAIMNLYVMPACLYTAYQINQQRAVASGWGTVGYFGDPSKDLLKVTLELFTQTKCNYTYRNDYGGRKLKNGIMYDTQLCAGSTTDIKDTCPGDSGGPLQIIHNENSDGNQYMYHLIGITSFGRPCGYAKNTPGVYTRISAYIQWIEDIVWP